MVWRLARTLLGGRRRYGDDDDGYRPGSRRGARGGTVRVGKGKYRFVVRAGDRCTARDIQLAVRIGAARAWRRIAPLLEAQLRAHVPTATYRLRNSIRVEPSGLHVPNAGSIQLGLNIVMEEYGWAVNQAHPYGIFRNFVAKSERAVLRSGAPKRIMRDEIRRAIRQIC